MVCHALVEAKEGLPVMLHVVGLVGLVVPLLGQAPGKADALRTVAERSDYRATARYDDVAAWCRDFASGDAPCLSHRAGPVVGRAIHSPVDRGRPAGQDSRRGGELGQAGLPGRSATSTPARFAARRRCRCCCARCSASLIPLLLKDVILAVAPIYNTDGNERVSKTNRPGQVGPEEGMGQRANARGLDLNRDFIKLEAPETRALVRFLNEWNPHLFIDTHTTDGSYHRYIVTYEGPKNPAGDPKIMGFMRQTFFPELSASFEKQTGQKAFYYGNFNRDHTQWTSYPAEGRYGTTYVGLRNRLSILSEAYSHAPYKDASARHARLRAGMSANGREPQGRDHEVARPGTADGRAQAVTRRQSSPSGFGADPLASQSGRETRDLARFCRA